MKTEDEIQERLRELKAGRTAGIMEGLPEKDVEKLSYAIREFQWVLDNE